MHRDRLAQGEWVYAGFWIRLWAALIDSALLLCLLYPALSLIPSAERAVADATPFTSSGRLDYAALAPELPGPMHILLYWVLPAAIVILFWWACRATPGKMAIRARIIDARHGGPPTTGQYLRRYLGYYLSSLPLGLGLLWVGIDARKQGWHDKLARTVVVRSQSAATFDTQASTPAATGWKDE